MLIELVVAAALGGMHKCTAADGRVSYSDRPCPAAAKAEQVTVRNDRSSTPYVPDVDVEPAEPAQAGPVASAPPPAAPQAGRMSVKCVSSDGAEWYRHDRCPKFITYRLRVIDVAEVPVKRSEACREIERVDPHNRPGSWRDQKASTADKAAGRDEC